MVHAKYDSHFVPRPIPYYRAISTFNYPVLERVGVPTLRTITGTISRMAAKRSLECMIYCIKAYDLDFIVSGIPLA